MTIRYVENGGAAISPYDDISKAAQTITQCLTVCSQGDEIHVSNLCSIDVKKSFKL